MTRGGRFGIVTVLTEVQMLEVKGGFLGKVPVFACVLVGNQGKLSRVAHASFDNRNGVCYFPAYHPFITTVVSDMQTVFPQVSFSDKAKAHLDAAHEEKKKYLGKVMRPDFQYK